MAFALQPTAATTSSMPGMLSVESMNNSPSSAASTTTGNSDAIAASALNHIAANSHISVSPHLPRSNYTPSLDDMSSGSARRDDMSLDTSSLEWQPPQGYKLFIGSIPPSCNELDLKAAFGPFGTIVDCVILKDRFTRQSKGCGFVVYSEQSSADAAIATLANKMILPNAQRELIVRYAGTRPDDDHKLYVSMLSAQTNEEDLREIFSPFGPLTEVVLLRQKDAAGTSKGSAFVKYANRPAADAAIQALDKQATDKYSNAVLHVRFAHTKDEKVNHFRRAANGIGNLPTPNGNGNNGNNSQNGQQNNMMPLNTQQLTSSLLLQLQQQQQRLQQLQAQQNQQRGAVGGSNNFALLNQARAASTNQQDQLNALLSQLLQQQQQPQPQVGSSSPSSFSQISASSPVFTNGNPNQLSINTQTNNHNSNSNSNNNSAAAMVSKDARGPFGCNLFVYNIPDSCTEADLLSLFSAYGGVLSCKVQRDRQTGLSKGYGFVSYTDAHAAQLAIVHLNQSMMSGRKITVRLKGVNQEMGGNGNGTVGGVQTNLNSLGNGQSQTPNLSLNTNLGLQPNLTLNTSAPVTSFQGPHLNTSAPSFSDLASVSPLSNISQSFNYLSLTTTPTNTSTPVSGGAFNFNINPLGVPAATSASNNALQQLMQQAMFLTQLQQQQSSQPQSPTGASGSEVLPSYLPQANPTSHLQQLLEQQQQQQQSFLQTFPHGAANM